MFADVQTGLVGRERTGDKIHKGCHFAISPYAFAISLNVITTKDSMCESF